MIWAAMLANALAALFAFLWLRTLRQLHDAEVERDALVDDELERRW